MDFGLRGKHALVCGASKGLGFACADALAADSRARCAPAAPPVPKTEAGAP